MNITPGAAYAIFRMPHGNAATLIEQTQGEPLRFTDATQLNGRSGFVMAPFVADRETPILLILPQRTATIALPDTDDSRRHTAADTADAPPSEEYAMAFNTFHQATRSGRFTKLVLARQATEPLPAGITPLQLFFSACRLYPRLFVTLVSAPQCGTWLMATPEILLEGKQDTWHTIALAGTMRLRDDELQGEGQHLRWSTKNIEEQRIVASYIASTLRTLGATFTEEGPRTVRAADLVHLRSDFTFTMPDIYNKGTRAREEATPHNTGTILAALHPTPAVCGLPKDDAATFIVSNEPATRTYYSGFTGPLAISGQTSLFVSLRCMSIAGSTCRLYAGGGILPTSTCAKEWQETEAKMRTMRRLLQQRP